MTKREHDAETKRPRVPGDYRDTYRRSRFLPLYSAWLRLVASDVEHDGLAIRWSYTQEARRRDPGFATLGRSSRFRALARLRWGQWVAAHGGYYVGPWGFRSIKTEFREALAAIARSVASSPPR